MCTLLDLWPAAEEFSFSLTPTLPIAIKYGMRYRLDDDSIVSLPDHYEPLSPRPRLGSGNSSRKSGPKPRKEAARPELTRIVKFQPRALITPALSWLERKQPCML